MIFKQFLYHQTGCAAYLSGCGGRGAAVVVDPQLHDVEAYVAFAAERGMAITHVVDTHVHADHLSGGRALAAATGAAYCLHASADVGFPFHALTDGEQIVAGNLELTVVHTPGHAPESICLVATDRTRGGEPWFVMTGDTLFVGSVGRPDLPGQREAGASALFDSLHERLLTLPDRVEVYPGHFAGSACGAGLSGKPMSTIGFERRFNDLVTIADRRTFIETLLYDLPALPARMQETLARNQGRSPSLPPDPLRSPMETP